MSARKIFNYDNFNETKIVPNLQNKSILYNNTITACGCLFYKINNKKKLKLLLIKYDDPSWPRLDDFGGQIDIDDITIMDAIARETSEESNGLIYEEYVKDIILSNKYKPFYNKQSKYYMILVKVDDRFFPDTTEFGNTEITDNIRRNIDWYDYETIKQNLSYRLLYNDSLMQYFNNIVS